MPAILKIVYNLNPSMDLSTHDDFTLAKLMHEEFGDSVMQSINSSMEDLVRQGLTETDKMRAVVDPAAKTFLIEREFTTAATAEGRKTWIESNTAASIGSFTRGSLTVTDNATLTP